MTSYAAWRSWHLFATRVLLGLAACIWPTALADNKTNPMHRFHSRPDLVAPILTTELYEPALLSPGYIFLAPYQAEQDGPYIYDNQGNLVWSGFGASGPASAHAPYVCNHNDTAYLCYFQGVQMLGYGWGHGVIMDQSYRIVRSVEAATYQAASDEHEFRVMPDGKTALLSIYERRQYDLSDYGVHRGVGYIQAGVFQEIDIDTSKPVFEWNSLDYIPPSESFVLPGTTEISGDGYSRQSPWDYFHINSIDKNGAGDYLISARHVSAIYKISGRDGSILWRLGGIRSSFNETNFTFSSQHDARFLSSNETHETISFFDNASNGFNTTKPFSEGMILSLDLKARTATCIQVFHAPDPNGGMLSKSQGNLQLLPNGNAVVGWGNNAFFTEFTGKGRPVWHAWLAMTGTMVYRVQKFNWTGAPNTYPALYTYSRSGSDTVFYISWNGATEVVNWRIFVSDNPDSNHPSASSLSSSSFSSSFSSSSSSSSASHHQKHSKAYFHAITVPKSGFETVYRYPFFTREAYVEALDEDDRLLATSRILRTFVPNAALAPFCDESFCDDAAPPSGNQEEDKDDDEVAEQEQEQEQEPELDWERERQRIEAEVEAEAAERTQRDRWEVLILMGEAAGLAALGATVLIFWFSGKGTRRRILAAPMTMLTRVRRTAMTAGGRRRIGLPGSGAKDSWKGAGELENWMALKRKVAECMRWGEYGYRRVEGLELAAGAPGSPAGGDREDGG